MSNKMRIRVDYDDDVIKALKEEAPELLEKHIKKQLRIPARLLQSDILQNLKQFQKGKWLLEDVIVTEVTGGLKKGKMWLKQGISGKIQPDRGDPQQYGFYIESGNQGKRQASVVRSRKNRTHFYKGKWRKIEKGEAYVRGVGEEREARPFMKPAASAFIDQETVIPYMDNAIQDAVDEFNK
jgi:hypothetical protein